MKNLELDVDTVLRPAVRIFFFWKQWQSEEVKLMYFYLLQKKNLSKRVFDGLEVIGLPVLKEF